MTARDALAAIRADVERRNTDFDAMDRVQDDHAPAMLRALVAVLELRDRVAAAPFEALTRDSMTRGLDAALNTLETR